MICAALSRASSSAWTSVFSVSNACFESGFWADKVGQNSDVAVTSATSAMYDGHVFIACHHTICSLDKFEAPGNVVSPGMTSTIAASLLNIDFRFTHTTMTAAATKKYVS